MHVESNDKLNNSKWEIKDATERDVEDISVTQLMDMPVTPPKSYCYVYIYVESVCKVMHVTMRYNFLILEVCY